VYAFASGATTASGVRTAADGRYTFGGLTPGPYKVMFKDCGGGGHVAEWYNNKTDMSTADPVTLTAGATTPNINAQLA
jgi:hypothetical protein